MTDNPQPKPPTNEQRLQAVAEKSNLTVRELKELVFISQRQENKSLKEANDALEESLRNQEFLLNQKQIRNNEIKLDLEFADLKPLYQLLKEGKYPKKKKLLFF